MAQHPTLAVEAKFWGGAGAPSVGPGRSKGVLRDFDRVVSDERDACGDSRFTAEAATRRGWSLVGVIISGFVECGVAMPQRRFLVGYTHRNTLAYGIG